MTRVIIIGSGNVAFHLTKAIKALDSVSLVQVYNRSKEVFKQALYTDLATTTQFNELLDADLYIIAISDNSITAVSEKLPKDKLVVHTSGSMPMTAISQQKRGVFYPLQSFSKAKDVDFKEIPFCLEARNATDLKLLEELAKALSDKVYLINSEQRKSLHVAAVFVNNFANHMFYQAAELCKNYNVPFEILKPLIQETVAKLDELSPSEAQTGPALRNDTKTLAAHLELLNQNQQEIYNSISKSIQENHGKKL